MIEMHSHIHMFCNIDRHSYCPKMNVYVWWFKHYSNGNKTTSHFAGTWASYMLTVITRTHRILPLEIYWNRSLDPRDRSARLLDTSQHAHKNKLYPTAFKHVLFNILKLGNDLPIERVSYATIERISLQSMFYVFRIHLKCLF